MLRFIKSSLNYLFLTSFLVVAAVEAVSTNEDAESCVERALPRSILRNSDTQARSTEMCKEEQRTVVFKDLSEMCEFSQDSSTIYTVQTKEVDRSDNANKSKTTGKTGHEIYESTQKKIEGVRKRLGRGDDADFFKSCSSLLKAMRRLHIATALVRSNRPKLAEKWAHENSLYASVFADFLPSLPDSDPEDKKGFIRFSARRIQGACEVLTPRARETHEGKFISFLEDRR